MKVKHLLREKMLWQYRYEEHSSHINGYVEMWEQKRPQLWWLILLTPLIIVLSPIIVVISYIITIKQLRQYDNEYQVYTVKKEEGQDNESRI
jgi:hypothetical protein